jgi:hypothetical protein
MYVVVNMSSYTDCFREQCLISTRALIEMMFESSSYWIVTMANIQIYITPEKMPCSRSSQPRVWANFESGKSGFGPPPTGASPAVSVFAEKQALMSKKRRTSGTWYTVDISVMFDASHRMTYSAFGLGLGRRSYM